MRKDQYRHDGFMYKIIELVAYMSAIVVAYLLSLRLDLFMGYDLRNYQAFYATIPFVLIISVILMVGLGLFRTVNKSRSENIAIIFLCVSGIMVGYFAVAFFERGFAMPRTVIMLGAVLQFVFFIAIKSVFLRIMRHKKRVRRTTVICSEAQKHVLVTKILSSHVQKERLTYCVDPLTCKDFMKYVDKAEKIYLSDEIPSTIKDKIITHCISLDKSLYMVPKTFEIAIFNSKLIQVSDVPVFKIESLFLSKEQRIVKRAFDLFIAIPVFVLVAPFMCLIALAILMTEGRPVIFKQERVTENNRTFMLYKFRSMHKDAEKSSGAIWATENDERVTRLGRFLRRFWLDELPQLINVLKGDMSLVGPRPERPVFIKQFVKEIPDFHYRLSVKAGVTGLAQVLGKYATSPDLKIKFDILYIKNANLFFDLKIILETAKKIVVGTLKRGENKDYTYHEILKRFNYCERCKGGVTIYK